MVKFAQRQPLEQKPNGNLNPQILRPPVVLSPRRLMQQRQLKLGRAVIQHHQLFQQMAQFVPNKVGTKHARRLASPLLQLYRKQPRSRKKVGTLPFATRKRTHLQQQRNPIYQKRPLLPVPKNPQPFVQKVYRPVRNAHHGTNPPPPQKSDGKRPRPLRLKMRNLVMPKPRVVRKIEPFQHRPDKFYHP